MNRRPTCHGLSQSRGMGKAPTQAPTTVQATVICRHVSHTDMALQRHIGHSTNTHSFFRNTARRGGLPVTAENSDPGLNVGAEHTQTPQRGQRRQQNGQREGLQGRPGRQVRQTDPQRRFVTKIKETTFIYTADIQHKPTMHTIYL